jgi:hypothetical protein
MKSTYSTCPLIPEIHKTNTSISNPVCNITYNRDSWVKLLQLPDAYSCDEALLLCQESHESWIAWVPSYGEIRLNKSDFYC